MEAASKKETIHNAVRAAQTAFSEAEPVAITPAPANSAQASEDFFGHLFNAKIPFPGVKLERVQCRNRTEAESRTLRLEFEKRGGDREAFIKLMVQDLEKIDRLKQAGISTLQITRMQEEGRIPRGWQVHHKLPLAVGGTNEFDNLILVKATPYYKAFTNEQNRRLQSIEMRGEQSLEWPVAEGCVFLLYG